jgi:hypothetical protein
VRLLLVLFLVVGLFDTGIVSPLLFLAQTDSVFKTESVFLKVIH